MAKKKAVKKAAPKKEKVDPNVMEEYFEEYTFICPVRGKVTQKVKVKKLKPKDSQGQSILLPNQDLVEKLDEEDNSLTVYTEEELDSGSGGDDDID